MIKSTSKLGKVWVYSGKGKFCLKESNRMKHTNSHSRWNSTEHVWGILKAPTEPITSRFVSRGMNEPQLPRDSCLVLNLLHCISKQVNSSQTSPHNKDIHASPFQDFLSLQQVVRLVIFHSELILKNCHFCPGKLMWPSTFKIPASLSGIFICEWEVQFKTYCEE